jgi:hypothetical protein
LVRWQVAALSLSPATMGLDQDHDRDMILQRLEKIKEKQNGEIHQVTTKSMIYALFSDANSSVCAMWISNLINLVILASTFGFVAETDPTLRGESYSTVHLRRLIHDRLRRARSDVPSV